MNNITVRSAYKDKKNFTELPDLRKGIIEEAPNTPLRANYAVNSAANFLHPSSQKLKVKEFAEITRYIRIYVLEPDAASGTAKIAYFRPGQKIEISVDTDDGTFVNTYTICSSPLRSIDDEYVILVNKEDNSIVSEYIFNNWVKETKVTASSPFGFFYYQPIRDLSHIVALCDNTGYQPFLAMAEAIGDGSANMDLTLIYAARKQSEAIMNERFTELAENKHFRVIFVFSDEHVFKCERGFITKTLIEKHAPSNKYSLFVSGSSEMYNRISPQIEELNLENKLIRYNK